jgi:hypothetical protein
MAVELSTVLPGLLNTYAGSSSEAFTPGTAAVTIKNRYHKWRPRDFNSQAVPVTANPSAGVQTATVAGIQAMFAANVVCEFEGGGGSFYAVDSTIAPANFSASSSLDSKQIHFNDTTIKALGTITNYLECRDQGSAAVISASTPSDSSNLPAPETTRGLFDVTNCEYNSYVGKLTIDGASKDLAGLTCVNSQQMDAAGGTGSTWDQVLIKNCRWGVFGTPRYQQSRNFLASPLVSNVVHRMRISACDIPILSGGNMIDGCHFGMLNISQTIPGSRSYISTCEFICGALYMSGPDTSTYGFDIQNTHMIFGSCYAESNFAAPIWGRAKSWVQGTVKYGAGATTVFGKKSFVYNDDTSGGGLITVHERSAGSADMLSVVLLKAKTSGARNYHVIGTTSEAETPPFRMEAGTGTISTDDKLTSFLSNGAATWTVGGTSAAPTVTRGSGI